MLTILNVVIATVSEDYHKNINALEKATTIEEVEEVLKNPLYQNNKQQFVSFSTKKIKDSDIRLTQKVYLNHQLMRYYVSVEADFDNSFIYLIELIKLLEGKEDNILTPNVLGDAYFIASWINQVQYDLPQSRKYAEKLLKHADKFKLNNLLIKAKMMLAELTQHEGNIKLGIEQFKSIEQEVKIKNDSVLLNRLYLLLSNAYTEYNKEDSAFHYAKMAYRLVPVKNSQLKAFSSIHLARGYMQNGELDKAINLTTEALEVVENLESKKEIKDLHNFLAEAHKSTGNFEQALLHLEKFMELDREQASLLSAANISDLEAKLSDEKHDFEIKLKQKELAQKNKQTIILGIFLVFAVLFIALVVRGYIVKKRQSEIIQNQKLIVEEKNKEIMDSITYAKRIQTAILPPNKVVKTYLQDSFVLYKPKDIVAGDFYWMESVSVEGKSDTPKVLFAAADCTGHGVPGAMVSVVCNNGLNRSIREFGLIEPGEILDKTREIVVQEFEKSEEEVKDGMDIALCCLEGNNLKYAGAHNPLWIIRNNSIEIEEIKADKQPIGKFDAPVPYTTHSIKLNNGDTFYIFSDGYADQFGGDKGKKMKTTNFKKLLLSIQKEAMDKQKQLIDEAFEHWKGGLEQLDDVCIIGVRI